MPVVVNSLAVLCAPEVPWLGLALACASFAAALARSALAVRRGLART